MDYNTNSIGARQLYKSSEVAKMLGISIATLKNHYKAGLIVAMTINGHRYYTPEAIDEYLGRKGSR